VPVAPAPVVGCPVSDLRNRLGIPPPGESTSSQTSLPPMSDATEACVSGPGAPCPLPGLVPTSYS